MLVHRRAQSKALAALITGAIAVAFVIIAGAAAVGYGLFALKSPYKGYAGESVLVRIQPRTPTVAILTALERPFQLQGRLIPQPGEEHAVFPNRALGVERDSLGNVPKPRTFNV